MGIRNLHKFLLKHHPSYYKNVSLSDYRGKKLAIDVNLYLFKYKSIYKEKWPSHFIEFLSVLTVNGIQCICIYDTGSPIEKAEKKDERRTRKRNAIRRIQDIEHDVQCYNEDGEISPLLQNIMEKRGYQMKKLLPSPANLIFDRASIDRELSILQNQVVSISKMDLSLSKTILDLFGIRYYDSENEAETLCAHLCCHQIVDAVLSNDTDVMVYGTPIFLTKLEISRTGETTCMEIRIREVVNSLHLTLPQFVDLCIMCGTDYNKNIYRVGSEKAFKLIQKHSSLEQIESDTSFDTTILNFRRVRELFSVPDELSRTYEVQPGHLVPRQSLMEFCTIYNFKPTKLTLSLYPIS